MKTIEKRIQDLENRIQTEDKPVWFEQVEGQLFARYADGRLEPVDEVEPGYKLYIGVTPYDFDQEQE